MEKEKQSGRDIDAQIRKAYRSAFSGENGRVLREDLEFTANQQCHAPGDPYTSAFNEGKRIMARNFLLLGEVDNG